jgi:NTE family protein
MEPPVALALAAGGARGAFQAGALLCLAEHGLRFGAVAGSSIGSLNGAFLVQGDGSPGHVEGLCRVWRSLPEAGLVQVHPGAARAAAAALCRPGPVLAALAGRLAAGQTALLDPAPLAAVLDRVLDYGRICRAPADLIVALLPEVTPAYDLVTAPWRTVTYLEARHLDGRALRAALLAAVAIPIAFPARRVLDRHHADAGMADPLPARVLHERGARKIVSVFLSDGTPQNRADFPGTTLLQVRPSPGMRASLPSIFDFSAATVERLIDLGYADARSAVGEAQALAQEMIALARRGADNAALAARLPRRR